MHNCCLLPRFAHLLAFAFLIPEFFSLPVYGQSFPTGFSAVEVANGIFNPTAMTMAPDGRIFIARQTGILVVIKNGVKLATPAIRLPVSSSGERGLIGLALHPSFSTNGVIYLFYTLPDGSRNRVSRFWMTGDIINPSSEQVIFELDPVGTSENHYSGAMQFKGDKLYIATGDNYTATNAQNLNNTHGKLLRINANGSIPGDNPFFSSTATRQRNSIWAYGLRNPYTFDIQPGTGRVLVNDVGQAKWEEVNDATDKGKNFGWPGSEGMTNITGYTSPLHTYPHGSGDGVGCAITGGTFFNPSTTNYPSAYIGKYFFQDYCNGWINYLDLSIGVQRHPFATGLPTDALGLDVNADGNLYFLTRAGKLYKIQYAPGAGDIAPVITDQPDNVFAAIGQSCSFTVSASGTSPISYQWRKNGVNISGANWSTYTIPAVQASDAAQYSVRVFNSFGEVLSTAATLSINSNSLPVPQIVTPTTGAMYRAGDLISFSGTASDPEDGSLPASAFSWTLLFHHDAHVHDGPPIADSVTTGSVTIPNLGETSINVFYRLRLTVTDSEGLTNSVFADIKPHISVMSLQSNPPGLNLTMDGQPVTSIAPIKSVEGILRTLGIVSSQSSNNVTYSFASWAHGGSDSQTIPTPIDNTTYTANFSKPLEAPWRTTDIGRQNIFGNASINAGTFTLSASGRDIYNMDDHFRFVYQSFTGDCDIRARVTGMTNTNAWAKAGVMIRETLQPNSKHAMTILTPTSGTSFQRRLTTAGATASTNGGGAPPYWVRLVRRGGNFTAYTSSDGSAWTQIGTPVTVSMNSTVFAGLVVTSHNTAALCTATMTDVSVMPGTSSSSVTHQIEYGEPLAGHYVMEVYPNPVDDDILFVRISSKYDGRKKLQVINALGQIVLEREYEPSGTGDVRDELDISNINSGIYVVRTSIGTALVSKVLYRR
jgi:glucose/arabinose dehydrogenase